eukprot:427045-Hanusia_phi.AAC.1
MVSVGMDETTATCQQSTDALSSAAPSTMNHPLTTPEPLQSPSTYITGSFAGLYAISYGTVKVQKTTAISELHPQQVRTGLAGCRFSRDVDAQSRSSEHRQVAARADLVYPIADCRQVSSSNDKGVRPAERARWLNCCLGAPETAAFMGLISDPVTAPLSSNFHLLAGSPGALSRQQLGCRHETFSESGLFAKKV